MQMMRDVHEKRLRASADAFIKCLAAFGRVT